MAGADSVFLFVCRMTLTEEPCYQAPLHDSGQEKAHKWDINDNTLPMVSLLTTFKKLNRISFAILYRKSFIMKIPTKKFEKTEILKRYKTN